jgi:UDP-N-acetyl-D-mannosaminuronic acid dehydrogenase
MTPKCSAAAIAFYKRFVQGECIVTSVRTAEMCKLAENSFRDVNIAFANELSIVCDELGIDVWELIALANRHPRVKILQPGCGVGGHCIAVDPWFIVDSAPESAKLIRMARTVNDAKADWVMRKVKEAIEELVAAGMTSDNIRTVCFGISFKPDVDDLRESPALRITRMLIEHHQGKIAIVEPNLQVLPDELKAQAALMTLHKAISWGHIFVLLVDHAEFKQAQSLFSREHKVIDTRGIWRVEK